MSNTVDNCMAAYLGHRDYAMDGMIHFACDAAPKKQMTLQEHLKKYHDRKMPKGRCKFLKQYEKEHPEEFKKAVEASAEEKNVDVANKNAAPKRFSTSATTNRSCVSKTPKRSGTRSRRAAMRLPTALKRSSAFRSAMPRRTFSRRAPTIGMTSWNTSDLLTS